MGSPVPPGTTRTISVVSSGSSSSVTAMEPSTRDTLNELIPRDVRNSTSSAPPSIGCATITLRKIEYDAYRPSVQILERLAMALDVPLKERADFVRRARQAVLDTPDPEPTPTPPS